jgi:hypothetical protein
MLAALATPCRIKRNHRRRRRIASGRAVYAYALGNPISWVDPSGLNVAVVINGPTSSNPFGHAAIAVTGEGVYSFGNTTPLGSSLTAYLQREAPRRDSNVIVIDTTPQQDAQIMKYLRKQKDNIGKYPDNCSYRTSSALNAGGMPDIYSFGGGTNNFPVDTFDQAEFWQGQQGGQTYDIPRNSTSVPSALNEFNP